MPDSACIHAVAQCHDCEWREEDYLKNVSELAHNHAKDNKHKVELELGFFIDGTKASETLKYFGITEEGYEEECVKSELNEGEVKNG